METNSDKVMQMCLTALQTGEGLATALQEAVWTMEATARQRRSFLDVVQESQINTDKRIEQAERSLKIYDRLMHADYWVKYPPAPKKEEKDEE